MFFFRFGCELCLHFKLVSHVKLSYLLNTHEGNYKYDLDCLGGARKKWAVSCKQSIPNHQCLRLFGVSWLIILIT